MKHAVAKPLSVRDSEVYLRRLGERVRTLRNQRGMSRKALAQHAKVSERYLAQLEVGKGNVLDRAAAADRPRHRPAGDPARARRRRTAARPGAAGTIPRAAGPAGPERGARPAAAPFRRALGRPAAPAHRAARPARRRQVHARPPAGRAAGCALHRARPRDRAPQRRLLERDLRHVRPGDLPPRRARGAGRRAAPAPRLRHGHQRLDRDRSRHHGAFAVLVLHGMGARRTRLSI